MRLPPPFPGPFFEVDLSAEQDRAGREVLERHRPEIETILRETFPKVREVNERIEKELREVLTAEQQKRFDDLKRERPRRPT